MSAPVLLDALERWLKVKQGGGVMLREVGVNGGFKLPQTRADAIYVGFTSRQGRRLEGFEVKISRSDWLHELAQPEKGAFWQDSCHRWWVVTIPGVVLEAELPEGWGLLVMSGRGLRPHVAATTRDVEPSWDAVRSIMARWDTLDRKTDLDLMGKEFARGVETGRAEAGYQDRRDAEELERLRARDQVLKAIETDLGLGEIKAGGRWGWGVSLDDLRSAVRAEVDVKKERERVLAIALRARDELVRAITSLETKP
jgi:hypothetical protein